MRMPPSLLALVLCGTMHAATGADAATTLLTAERIRTMDPSSPEVEAMVFDGMGRIVALGTQAALAARYPDATRIDAAGATVVPGLIDAHGHVSGLGFAQLRADLMGTRSKQEIVERLLAFSRDLPADAWLLGRGWDQNDWPDRLFPTASDLDAAFPDRPVWLERVDGHAGWANSAALRAARERLPATGSPAGGEIRRDASGQPTGVFVDNAAALVDAVVPPAGPGDVERALVLGMQAAIEHGLTGVHDAGVSLEQMDAYRRLADRGALPLRITAMADGDAAALAWLCKKGLYAHADGRLRMRTVKVYADGALGSRGAAMIDDYSDTKGHRGLMVTAPEAMRAIFAKAKKCGVQVATHAIGDRGAREVLDGYGDELDSTHVRDHSRWRMEHAQIMAPDDIHRLPAYGIIASMQPTHATSDMPWAEARVGKARIQGAYAWRRMRDAGVRLALGSDFPVESVDPRLGLYAATTRSDAAGKPEGGWQPQDKLTAYEALRGFTLDAAYAGFAEDEVGSLAVGKRADFVVLGQDPLAIDPRELRNLSVRATYVDGKPVFKAPAKP